LIALIFAWEFAMRKISFLFSGQGAQTPGMGKELHDTSAAARAVFETADRVLGRSISELCFYGSPEELNLTHNTQPCMLAADLAAYEAVREKGLRPDAAAGFSLGEYAALAAAGVISQEDAFQLIQLRADAMQQAAPVGEGAMAAVMRLSPQEVERLCKEVDGYVVPANYNSPVQTVVSGEAEAVDRLLILAKERRVRAMKLPVSAPFHCKLMEPARAALREAFRRVRFQDAGFPIYMNVDGKPHTDAEDIKQCVLRQTVSPVRWTDTVQKMKTDMDCGFLELGVGSTLCGFVKKTSPESAALHVENAGTLESVLRSELPYPAGMQRPGE